MFRHRIELMVLAVVLLCSTAFFSSCLTQGRMSRHSAKVCKFASDNCGQSKDTLIKYAYIKEYIYKADTTLKYSPDSFALQMLIECDDEKKILVRQLSQKNTIPAQVKVKDNYIYITANTDSIEVLKRIIKEQKTKIDTIYQVKDKVLIKSEKYIPAIYKISAWALWCGVLLLFVIVYIDGKRK